MKSIVAEEPKEKIVYGKRIIRETSIEYDFSFLCESICQIVPEPLWPDPDKEPLPPPVITSIQKKPPTRNSDKPKITNFSIWTPIDEPELQSQQDPT